MADLRMGAAILKETLDRETEKEARLQRNREERKAAEAAVAQNVRFLKNTCSNRRPSFIVRKHSLSDRSSWRF